MDAKVLERACGCALGAAVGDALGMPMEFRPRRPTSALVSEMEKGRLPAGTFTDDTEMALALADSLLACFPLDGSDLSRRFVAWLLSTPDDVGIHTSRVLLAIAGGQLWTQAARATQSAAPDSAGNGSIMRCWPVALAHWSDAAGLERDSRLQSEVTHPNTECVAASALINLTICHLIRGSPPSQAVVRALEAVDMPPGLRTAVSRAPHLRRSELVNGGWVRQTVESVLWGLLTTGSFEDCVSQVASLGNDADTAASVAGALAGAAYGFDGIPARWRNALQGEWPLRSGVLWQAQSFADLADRLLALGS